LSNTQIQESHTLSNLDDTLGTDTSHRGSQPSVQLQDGEFVEEGRVGAFGEFRVADDLVVVGSFDLFPVTIVSYESSESASRIAGEEKRVGNRLTAFVLERAR
jgi:hypothetical protein